MPSRRTLMTAAAAALPTLALGGRAAWAQKMFNSMYMFIPAGPGGGWDGLGRAIEQVARQADLVGSFQFENVGGAGGTVGLPRFIAQRRGRGDSLMVAGAVMVGASLTNKSPVSIKDVVPIARMIEEAGVIVVPATSGLQTLQDLLDALKQNPGAVPVAGGSAGGIDHITLGMILGAIGRRAREASYVAFAGGGPAQAAILGGQVKAGISGYSEFAEQIKAGRMRALATTGEERLDPNIPTLKESGIDVVITNWRGVFAPPGISAQEREKLIAFVTAVHALPAWQALLRTREWDDAFLAGDAFAQFIQRDIANTELVLKEVGLV